MDLNYIYHKFKELGSIEERKSFLMEMKELNLPYEINWDNLVEAWDNYNYYPVSNNSDEEDEDVFEEDIPFFE